ncbi:MAG TPA: EAL domain-containing protein [Terracidiphilus sp.]|jgi:EAL domain-containing protein (putative c-di-GMP-specific phosphodiesterase class I)|nr:EAL domain-containing protein [Terracidiphilus sp.]
MTIGGHILVIDDNFDIGEIVHAAAQSVGMRCTTSTDAAQLPQLLTPDVTLVLLDLVMPRIDGIEALRILRKLECKASVVLMSGISKRVMETAEKLAQALELKIAGHLQKPFRLADVERLLQGHATEDLPVAVQQPRPTDITDQDLHTASRRNEFLLYYQPQIDLHSGEVEGLEALARWLHPDRGILPPDSFIPRLEALGEIDCFGWQMADLGLSEARRFAVNEHPAPRIALNVSVQSLRNLQFPDAFLELAQKHRIAPESIMVEITESGLMHEPSHALDVLARLRMKNVQLSIDDFGTGYAMMQHLVSIPANELKIDRVFVHNMQVNSSDRVMVQKTIEIGHELGMAVTAEGVETQAQLDFLRRSGCDRVQGFFFSRPLPPDAMAQWLDNYYARLVHA